MNPTALDLQILTLLLKGFLIVAPLTVLLLFAKKCSARTLSLGWRAILLSIFVLPLVSWMLPALPLMSVTPPTPVISAETEIIAAESPQPLIALPTTEGSEIAPQASPQSWIFLLWITGTIFLLVRLALAHFRVSRLKHHSQEATANDINEFTNLPAHIQVKISPNIDLPIVCGLFRPSIILPAEATTWDEQTRHAVITHELTHIKRKDLLFLLLSGVVTACHWPNPLVWLAARRMRIDDERTADDSVLASDVDESSYASFLFDLARGKQLASLPLATQSMADRSTVGTRIERLLDEQQRRGQPSPLTIAGGIIATLAVTLLIGIASIQEVAAEAPAPAKPKELSKKTIEEKLNQIIIPEVSFQNVSLEEALDFIRQKSKELDNLEKDPKQKGINFVVRKSPNAEGEELPQRKIAELRLRNVPLKVALDFIVDATAARYQVDDYAVTILPKGPDLDLISRTWKVPHDQFSKMLEIEKETILGVKKVRISAQELLQSWGVAFREGTTAHYIPKQSKLVIRNTKENLDIIDQQLEKKFPKQNDPFGH